MQETNCDLLVIGAGPGGYVCAIRASQLGLDTIIVEENKFGGTCLNAGCIPSKALIHAADELAESSRFLKKNSLGIRIKEIEFDFSQTMAWKDQIVNGLNKGVGGLLKKSGVKTITGKARFHDGKTIEIKADNDLYNVRAKNVVIATGSAPIELPFLPFGETVISSTDALSLTDLPKNLAVVGGGYIGLELGIAFAKLGVNVSIIEAAEKLLPLYDRELSDPIAKRLHQLNVSVYLKSKAKKLSTKSKALIFQNQENQNVEITAEKVLVTVGRMPVTDNIGLENLVIETNNKFINVDKSCQTSMRGIYAIGDVTGDPMLAHRAMAQGEMVADIISGKNRIWDDKIVPAVCFTDPEIVTAGLLPNEAKDLGIKTKIGKFPLAANGKALTMQSDGGFIRVVAREDNHLILGIQAVGTNISELSASFALAIEMGACLEDLAATIHAHPTQSEGIVESVYSALGSPLHM